MPIADYQAMLGLGAFLILLGVAFILWGRREEGEYYDDLATRRDVKEFLTHDPERSWMGAWRVGGIVSLVIGIGLAIGGAVLWLK